MDDASCNVFRNIGIFLKISIYNDNKLQICIVY